MYSYLSALQGVAGKFCNSLRGGLCRQGRRRLGATVLQIVFRRQIYYHLLL